MRKIEMIVIHCSATREDASCPLETLRMWHLHRGFSDIGYHYYITRDGALHEGRRLEVPGAHAAGFNAFSIGVCYEGGLDAAGRCADTRTPAQKDAMDVLVKRLVRRYPGITKIVGHRDLSCDADGDGIMERHEWVKQCPCFDAAAEYGSFALWNAGRKGGSND